MQTLNIKSSAAQALKTPTRRQKFKTQTHPIRRRTKYNLPSSDPSLRPKICALAGEPLALKVKSIYDRLILAEEKCEYVDRAGFSEDSQQTPRDFHDTLKDLTKLHHDLLSIYHDFFLASQHPSASTATRDLASMWNMPMRMWTHGIHAYLEFLRVRLPHSLDHLVTFCHLSYRKILALNELVPAFEDVWIECLGDLSRFRMACENNDIRERQLWARISTDWYSKAVNRNPTVGRLYHHLAIVAQPRSFRQLYYYSISLNTCELSGHTRENMSTRFRPFFFQKGTFLVKGISQQGNPWHPDMTVAEHFVVAHVLISRLAPEGNCSPKPTPELVVPAFLNNLDNHISRTAADWKMKGVFIAVVNIAAWYGYGKEAHVLRQLTLLRPALCKVNCHSGAPRNWQEPIIPMGDIPDKVGQLSLDEDFARLTKLTNETFAIALRRVNDINVLPHIHVMLVWISTFAHVDPIAHLIADTPWAELVVFLNVLIESQMRATSCVDIVSAMSRPIFPKEDEQTSFNGKTLPEDYLIRGLIWAEEYLPHQWFEGRDEQERFLERASTIEERKWRILKLAFKITTVSQMFLCEK